MAKQNQTDKALRRGMWWGLVIGGIMGLWNAPQSGFVTRQNIQRVFRWRTRNALEKVQGEGIEKSIEQGKTIAHQQKAQHANVVQPIIEPKSTPALPSPKKSLKKKTKPIAD
jgi:gas vesicle protein